MLAKYIPELDGMRAIAAISVVAFHTKLPGLPGGFLGVDVFFVLSGYLTASIALSGKYNFFDFLERRLRRLWPLLIFISASVAIYVSFTDKITAFEVLPGAFFLGNISTAFFGSQGSHGPLGHTWTLATEMQFYVLIALLAVSIRRTTFRLLCVMLFMAATFVRFRYAYLGEWQLGYNGPIAHSSGLFAGAVLATLPLDRLRQSTPLLVLSTGALSVAFLMARFQTADALLLWISVVELGTIGLIVAIVTGRGTITPILRAPVMRSLGTLSFGVYLWHYPIAVAARQVFEPTMAFIFTISVSVILATFSYHLIEQPMRAPKARRNSLSGAASRASQ